MFYTIYKITNTINGKYYIGKHQTKDLDDRYMGSGKLLKLAINKYGIEYFVKEILHIFDTEEDMNSKEKELVVISEQTYNLNEGGHGGFSYINSKPELVAKKNKNLWSPERATIKWKEKYDNDPEFRNQHLEKTKKGFEKFKEMYPNGTWTGRTHSKESKLKMSEAKKNKYNGNKNPQWGTMWITNGITNKKIKKEGLIPENWYKGRVL